MFKNKEEILKILKLVYCNNLYIKFDPTNPAPPVTTILVKGWSIGY